MLTVNQYCRDTFGEKLYKLSLNGGFSCPNRDGTLGHGGCIFCSAGGSGDFAEDAALPISEQIDRAKMRVAAKYHGSRYIAYFQAFTNTYAPAHKLRELYLPVVQRDDIAALSIATRPDCLDESVYKVLSELNEIKPLWVELGLQTVKPESIKYIRRGYETKIYDKAVAKLNHIGIHSISHVILGLPGESHEDMLNTVRHVVDVKSGGIKLQLLHVLEGTALAADFCAGKFEVLSMEEYIRIVKSCLEVIPNDMVVHRLTGDGAKKDLIAPLWSADKKRVLNTMRKELGI